jgi:hypothetical protein
MAKVLIGYPSDPISETTPTIIATTSRDSTKRFDHSTGDGFTLVKAIMPKLVSAPMSINPTMFRQDRLAGRAANLRRIAPRHTTAMRLS